MSKFLFLAILLSAAALAAEPTQHSTSAIRGEYMETRSADVYTGQCFANGEVNLTGSEAILAWKIDIGSWDGIALDGLSVAAAVRAKATLGDPYADPYPAKSVLMVDDTANPEQQKALVSFARHMGGELLANVVAVERQPVILETPQNEHQHGRARMRAGQLAAIETRSLKDTDHLCGNEVTFYPPLVKLDHSTPAVALTDSFQGDGLGQQWTLHDKRSAFVGRFSVNAPAHTAHK